MEEPCSICSIGLPLDIIEEKQSFEFELVLLYCSLCLTIDIIEELNTV
jgi:hypothetical protein